MGRKFKWTVEFFVDESWVADGFDFTKDGKVMITASLGEEQVTFQGTYRVDGNKVISTVEFGGKDQVIALTVTKLTDGELVVKDEKGAETTLAGVKDK